MSGFMCYFFQQGPSSTELFGGREPSGESSRLRPSASNERRHIHSTRGRQVSYQVDCSRRSCLQQILYQSRWQAVEFWDKCFYQGADKSLARPGRTRAQKHVRDARDFNNTEMRAGIEFSFFLQGKAPKEVHAILIETLACFVPGRAKDLSALLY